MSSTENLDWKQPGQGFPRAPSRAWHSSPHSLFATLGHYCQWHNQWHCVTLKKKAKTYQYRTGGWQKGNEDSKCILQGPTPGQYGKQARLVHGWGGGNVTFDDIENPRLISEFDASPISVYNRWGPQVELWELILLSVMHRYPSACSVHEHFVCWWLW